MNSGYFKALGLRPVAGRFFGEEEDRGENPEQRAVLTEAAWRTQFGSDPSVVGRVFTVQEGTRRNPLRILGIAPGAATLPFAPDAEILLPIPSAGAGRSFLSAVRAASGVDPKGVITFQASVAGSLRPGLPAALDLADQIAAVPGVRRVAFAAELPVGATAMSAATGAHPGNVTPEDPMIAYRLIGPWYFETLGAQMAAGRTFLEEEIRQGRPVVILNQAASRRLFPGEGALGRTVQPAFLAQGSLVVGVRDIRTEGLDRAAAPMVYMPYLPYGSTTYIVRASGTTGAFLPLLKARVGAGNSGAVLRRFQGLADVLDDTVRERRIAGVLVGGFALLGLIISSVGLYGTLAAHVQQRRREIGVRIALGATARAVMTNVPREGMRIVAVGTVAGVAASVAAAHLIRPLLYEVGPLDVVSFAAA